MKHTNIFMVIAFCLGFTLLILIAATQADAATGAGYHREQAIMALGYVQDPRAYLYWKGTKEGLNHDQIQQLDRIAHCESHWYTGAQNKTSSAAGVFQIIQGTWTAYSPYAWSERYEYKANIDTAIKLYQRRGVQPWTCKAYV